MEKDSTDYTLNPELLVSAYSQGYFPMPDENQTDILWFRPDPRAIIPLDQFHASRSLKKKIRQGRFEVTFNQEFLQVIEACGEDRETWITQEFKDVYFEMHRLNFAHSVEIWEQSKLVGGTYGVCLGGAFFAESKFHRSTDASKLALYYLVERMKSKGMELLECQFLTPHLESLGAMAISDHEYIIRLRKALQLETEF